MSNRKEEVIYYRDVDLNFEPHPFTGDAIALKNRQAIQRALIQLFLMNPFDIPFNPDGVGLDSMLFEPNNQITRAQFRKRLEFSIKKYEKRVNLLKLDIELASNSQNLVITCEYEIVSLGTSDKLEYVLKRTN